MLGDVLAETTRKILPRRRHRTCPRVVKRARHNSYPVKRPGQTSTRHAGPPTISLYPVTPRAA